MKDINPCYYHATTVEPIDVIESWRLGFNLGNVIKYISRWNRKGSPTGDRIKAINYLVRECTGEWMPEEWADEIRRKALEREPQHSDEDLPKEAFAQ